MTGLFHLRIGAHIHVIPHSKGQIVLLYFQLTLQKDGIFLPIDALVAELLCCLSYTIYIAQSLICSWISRLSANDLFKLLGLKFVCYGGVIISEISLYDVIISEIC